jgi:hypothetical protein
MGPASPQKPLRPPKAACLGIEPLISFGQAFSLEIPSAIPYALRLARISRHLPRASSLRLKFSERCPS